MKRSKKELGQFTSFLERIKIIPTTSFFSMEAATIGGELKNKGVTIDPEDLLIAGMMRSFGFEKIVTRNKKHFSKIKGLKVISY